MSKDNIVFKGRGYTIHDFGRKSLVVVAYEPGKPRLNKSLGTSNIVKAKTAAKRIYNDYVQDKVISRRKNNLMSYHWADLYRRREIRVKNGDMLPGTLNRSKNAWKRLDWFYGDMLPAEAVKQENFDIYKNEMELRHPNCSLKPEHKYLSVLLLDLFKRGILKQKPDLEIGKSKKKNLRDKRIIPADVLEDFKQAMDECESPKMRLFMAMTMHGMRIEEVTCLDLKNLKKVKGASYWKIVKSKTGPRTIKLMSYVEGIIKELKPSLKGSKVFGKRDNPDKPVTTSTTDKMYREFRKEFELGDWQHHEFRHTMISRAINVTKNPGAVSRYFGLSLQEIDRSYLKLNEFETAICADAIEF